MAQQQVSEGLTMVFYIPRLDEIVTYSCSGLYWTINTFVQINLADEDLWLVGYL